MSRAIAALRLLRGRLHARAVAMAHAHEVWVIVEELDELINRITNRRRR